MSTQPIPSPTSSTTQIPPFTPIHKSPSPTGIGTGQGSFSTAGGAQPENRFWITRVVIRIFNYCRETCRSLLYRLSFGRLGSPSTSKPAQTAKPQAGTSTPPSPPAIPQVTSPAPQQQTRQQSAAAPLNITPTSSPVLGLRSFASLKLKPEEEETIYTLVHQICTMNAANLFFDRKNLNDQGDKVRHVHPLKSLEYIFSHKDLPKELEGLKNDRWNYLTWDRFITDTTNSLKAQAATLSIYKTDFARSLEINLADIDHLLSHDFANSSKNTNYFYCETLVMALIQIKTGKKQSQWVEPASATQTLPSVQQAPVTFASTPAPEQPQPAPKPTPITTISSAVAPQPIPQPIPTITISPPPSDQPTATPTHQISITIQTTHSASSATASIPNPANLSLVASSSTGSITGLPVLTEEQKKLIDGVITKYQPKDVSHSPPMGPKDRFKNAAKNALNDVKQRKGFLAAKAQLWMNGESLHPVGVLAYIHSNSAHMKQIQAVLQNGKRDALLGDLSNVLSSSKESCAPYFEDLAKLCKLPAEDVKKNIEGKQWRTLIESLVNNHQSN